MSTNAERQRRFRQRVNAKTVAELEMFLEQARTFNGQLLVEIERLNSEGVTPACHECGGKLACPNCSRQPDWGA